MNGVGRIGQPRKVQGVAPREIEHALNLLSALGGGDKGVRALLSDLQAAIAHNEKLLAELDEKLKGFIDLEKREHRLAELKSEVDSKFLKLEKIKADFKGYESDLAKGVYG